MPRIVAGLMNVISKVPIEPNRLVNDNLGQYTLDRLLVGHAFAALVAKMLQFLTYEPIRSQRMMHFGL